MVKKENFYVGLMSGTSRDGVDIALTNIRDDTIETIDALTIPYPEKIRTSLKRLCEPNADITLREIAKIECKLGEFFSDKTLELLKKHSNLRGKIKAIGTHGHTLYHMPENPFPYSLQVGGASIINARTGIKTICDFRSTDIAYGGEGAPLVPAFHQWAFSKPNENRIIINLGGIANITILHSESGVLGFDTGPGNCLMDEWYEKIQHRKFDHGGKFAASGQVNNEILSSLLNDDYFNKEPPKSTAREFFNLDYMYRKIGKKKILSEKPENIQATLLSFTAITIANAIKNFSKEGDSSIYLCGGGIKNDELVSTLKVVLEPKNVSSTSDLGCNPDYVEAVAFSWLAYMRVSGNPVIVTTNPNQESLILGAVYG